MMHGWCSWQYIAVICPSTTLAMHQQSHPHHWVLYHHIHVLLLLVVLAFLFCSCRLFQRLLLFLENGIVVTGVIVIVVNVVVDMLMWLLLLLLLICCQCHFHCHCWHYSYCWHCCCLCFTCCFYCHPCLRPSVLSFLSSTSKAHRQNIGSQFHRRDVNIRLEEELQADLNGTKTNMFMWFRRKNTISCVTMLFSRTEKTVLFGIPYNFCCRPENRPCSRALFHAIMLSSFNL